MKQDIQHKVDFNIIRYANCWEDPDLLIKALQPLGPGKSFLSIASAGDNSFMLLLLDPKQVVAVDLNQIQLYLVELKIAAIQTFDRTIVLEFLGFIPSTNRLNLLETLLPLLSDEARAYWQQNKQPIEQGIIHAGKFEKYFRLFAKRILPLIHTKWRKTELFRNKSEAEQENFYEQKWNNRRWRLLFRIFFSKYIMGKYGRDPQFLKEVHLSVSQYIYLKAAKQLKSKQAQTNFILYYNLFGRFDSFLPPYLQEENFNLIKQRIDRVVLHKGYAQEAIATYGPFDGMNLSNIFEYMDAETFTQVSKDLIKGSNPKARICYWNLMVPRRMSGILPDKVSFEKEVSHQLTAIDRGFFYNQFILDEIK